jgi:hypothetical protein
MMSRDLVAGLLSGTIHSPGWLAAASKMTVGFAAVLVGAGLIGGPGVVQWDWAPRREPSLHQPETSL